MYDPDSTIVFIYAALTAKKIISVLGCQRVLFCFLKPEHYWLGGAR